MLATEHVPPLNACRAFVFDLDGTLTVPQHDFDAIRDALDIPQGALILEHLAALPEAEENVKRAHLDAIEAEIASASKPAPGLFELLDTLTERKISFAILTRNSASNAWLSLHAIGADALFAKTLVIGRDEAAPKPQPAGIELLAQRLAQPAGHCAMVGDYVHDLAAGTAAGCHTVHIRHPNTPEWPELTRTRVNSLTELLRKL